MTAQAWLTIPEKAIELGKTIDQVRHLIADGKLPHKKKLNNRWVIAPEGYVPPDLTKKPKPAPPNPKGLMEVEEAEQHKKHYDALKSEGEYRKLELAIKQIEGTLVSKSDIEAEYADVIVTFRNKVLDLPSKLKSKCGEDLSQHAETSLLTICEDMLNELTEYKPRKLQKANATKPIPAKKVRPSQRKKRG